MLIRVSKSLSVKIQNPLKQRVTKHSRNSSEVNSCQKQKAPEMTSKFKGTRSRLCACICRVNTKFEIAITGTIIENLSFYSSIRRFGWPSYTSVVVINVCLCCLTGYVLRRRKK